MQGNHTHSYPLRSDEKLSSATSPTFGWGPSKINQIIGLADTHKGVIKHRPRIFAWDYTITALSTSDVHVWETELICEFWEEFKVFITWKLQNISILHGNTTKNLTHWLWFVLFMFIIHPGVYSSYLPPFTRSKQCDPCKALLAKFGNSLLSCRN